MKLTITTTPTGWEQKLMIGGKTYALTARLDKEGIMRSDEGFSFSGMMKRRGVDPDLAEAVADAVDDLVEFELGERMYNLAMGGYDT